MMIKKKLKIGLLAAACMALPLRAQEVVTVQAGDTITVPGTTVEEERLVVGEVPFFVPHYYLSAHVAVPTTWVRAVSANCSLLPCR